jgi:hypothetical protein
LRLENQLDRSIGTPLTIGNQLDGNLYSALIPWNNELGHHTCADWSRQKSRKSHSIPPDIVDQAGVKYASRESPGWEGFKFVIKKGSLGPRVFGNNQIVSFSICLKARNPRQGLKRSRVKKASHSKSQGREKQKKR